MPFCEKCGAELESEDQECPRCAEAEREAEAPPPAAQAPQKPPAPVVAPPPAAAPPPQPAKPTPWAIWSLVLGLVGLVACGGLTSPFAIWTGVRSNREGEGSGVALAGIILGIIGCVYLLGVIAYVLLVVGIVGAGIATGGFGAILPLL